MTRHPVVWRTALAGCPLLLAALLAPAAQAMAVSGPGGTAEQGRRLVVAAPAPGASQPALDLVAARLEAVDLAAGTVTLRGKPVPLHPQALRVLGNGGQVLGMRSLRAGQQVRLALEPAAPPSTPPAAASGPPGVSAAGKPAERRIVLIYIDG